MKATLPLFRRIRRLALTTKQTNKGYYKGTGSGSMGRHTKHGGYKIEWAKVRTYVVPENMRDFKLTPFVTKNMEPTRGEFKKDDGGPMDGMRYYRRWLEDGTGQ